MPKRPTAPEGLSQFNIRMPNGLIAALDDEVEELRRAHPGRTVTRSDVIREALYAHVASRQTGPKTSKK